MNRITAAKRARPSSSLRKHLEIARKRKHYLVNRPTQFQIMRQFAVVLVVGVSLGVSNSYVFRSMYELYSTSGRGDWVELGMILFYGGGLAGISLFLVYLLCLFYSHRTGGPADKIGGAIEQLAAGDLSVYVKLRDTDLLHDVARSLNLASRSWRRTIAEIEWTALQMREQANNVPELKRYAAALEALVAKIRSSRALGLAKQ